MKKIFYDFNAAVDYAQSIGIDCTSFIRQAGWNASRLTDIGQRAGFDIEGFSKVEQEIWVEEYDYTDRLGYTEHYKEIRFRSFVLYLEETGRRYVIESRDGKFSKFGLSSLELRDVAYKTFSYFKTELQEPLNIGKATKKKILDWAQFADALEVEKKAYLDARRIHRETTMRHIRENCPVLRVKEGDKPWNPLDFQQITMTYISPDGLKIVWEFGEDGSCGYSYGYDYTNADRLRLSLESAK